MFDVLGGSIDRPIWGVRCVTMSFTTSMHNMSNFHAHAICPNSIYSIHSMSDMHAQ